MVSFNRKSIIEFTLNKIYEQEYYPFEIIIFDNASDDGTCEMIEKKYCEVNLIKNNKNIGIEGYNIAFKLAQGQYFLILDDDSYPDKTTLGYGVEYLQSNQEFSVATFKIFNICLNKSETESFKLINPHLFHGCGTIWKRNVYENIGGYDSDYFLYYNEIDHSIRCYDQNIKIKYLPEKIVFHQPIPNQKVKTTNNYHLHKKKYEQYFSGHIRFLIKHFDLKYVLVYGLKWILNRFIIALIFNYYFSFFKSLIAIPKVIFVSRQKRKPVSKNVQKYYNYGSQPLIDRFYFPNYSRKK